MNFIYLSYFFYTCFIFPGQCVFIHFYYFLDFLNEAVSIGWPNYNTWSTTSPSGKLSLTGSTRSRSHISMKLKWVPSIATCRKFRFAFMGACMVTHCCISVQLVGRGALI